MKLIKDLIPDIYKTLERTDGWFTNEIADNLAKDLAKRLQGQLGERVSRPTLRLSKMGPRCPRALWYSIHRPETSEPLPPWATIKFSYGHILEAFILTLAKASDHTVTGEQDALTLDGILGHRDCVVDGATVDIKSASSRSFQKFRGRDFEKSDGFGYLDQLDGYTVAARDDPLVLVKDKAYILAVDKQLGHLALYEHTIREEHIRHRIEHYKQIVGRRHAPQCECGTEPIGASGNIRLDWKASYNSFKWECFPNLRCFLYKSGPEYLTVVRRKPDVPEVDRFGKIVYNQ